MPALAIPATPPSIQHSARSYEHAFTKASKTLEGDAAASLEGDNTKVGAAVHWERLPSGTPLRVWWEGCEDYFDCKILDWRVGYDDDRQLVYTHRCV